MKQHLIIVLAVILLTSACSSKNDTGNMVELPNTTIKSIAVMPVNHPDFSKNATVNKMLDKGRYVMANLLSTYFQDHEKIQIVSEDQFNSMGINHKEPMISQAYTAGRQLKSDAVLLVTLTRYLERDGGDYSVNYPASVAFEYRLLHPESGSVICSGVFDETQEAFTDNILSLKNMFSRGFKWISTKQLAQEGIETKLEECRYLNPAQK